MIVSSASSSGASRAIVSSTKAAGSITQMERGGCRLPTKSSSDEEPVAPSPASSPTASGLMS
jgi:hypothetical protein